MPTCVARSGDGNSREWKKAKNPIALWLRGAMVDLHEGWRSPTQLPFGGLLQKLRIWTYKQWNV
jgi:hypothetical protein